MAVAGILGWLQGGGHTPPVIGNGPTLAGIGSAMNPGPGPVTITVRGFTTLTMAGFGYPAQNGHLRG